MWVFTRPQGGQDYYLLICEITAYSGFCPIHRFDVNDQIRAFSRQPGPGREGDGSIDNRLAIRPF
jgi:hypothetical protein